MPSYHPGSRWLPSPSLSIQSQGPRVLSPSCPDRTRGRSSWGRHSSSGEHLSRNRNSSTCKRKWAFCCYQRKGSFKSKNYRTKTGVTHEKWRTRCVGGVHIGSARSTAATSCRHGKKNQLISLRLHDGHISEQAQPAWLEAPAGSYPIPWTSYPSLPSSHVSAWRSYPIPLRAPSP